MKKVMYLLSLLMIAILMGCSKNNDGIVEKTKTVVYELNMERGEGDAELTFTGEYVDKTGQKVAVGGAKLPFYVELKDVPLDVKTAFSGRLFSVNASQLIGAVSMKVTGIPNNRVLYNNAKTMNHTKNSAFTGDELREKTSFSFSE